MRKNSGLAVALGMVAAALVTTGCVSFPDAEQPLHTGMVVDVYGSHTSAHHDDAEGTFTPLQSSSVKLQVDKEFSERHPGFLGWFTTYWKDRLLDLHDIVQFDVAVGRGFVVNVRPTEYGQLGLGWYDGAKVGWRKRASGWWTEDRVERGFGPFYWLEVKRSADWGTKTLFNHNYDYTGWDIWEEDTKAAERDWADVGASVVIFFFGADVNVSPVEIFDAVFGWDPISFIQNIWGYHTPNFDLSGDDTWNAIKEELIEERGIDVE
ncbi:MAG: hypothetical protein ACYTG4_10705 [Planctomycetota bacterium]|jgi:hypothetical protein